ncbi:hypothetical protein [Streptomyces sp. DSM 118878]
MEAARDQVGQRGDRVVGGCPSLVQLGGDRLGRAEYSLSSISRWTASISGFPFSAAETALSSGMSVAQAKHAVLMTRATSSVVGAASRNAWAIGAR